MGKINRIFLCLAWVLIAFTALITVSCDHDSSYIVDWGKGIELEAKGITLERVSDSDTMEGSIPSTGGEFTLSPIDKLRYKNMTISSVMIMNGDGDFESAPGSLLGKWVETGGYEREWESDWGSVSYPDPYSIKIALAPNITGSARVFEFYIQYRLDTVIILISQPPLENNN